MKTHLLVVSLLLGPMAEVCPAENYPQFRGADSNAVSPSPLPLTWSDVDGERTNIRWKISVPGEGWSQPIVWGNRLYMTAAVPAAPSDRDAARPESNNGGYGRDRDDLVNVVYQYQVICLDADSGKEIWRVNRDELSQYSSPVVWKNSLRNELVVGGMIYRSYDPSTGELLWQLDMNKGRSSATPVAIGDRLYVGNEFRNRGGADDGGGRLYAIKPGGSGDITPADDGMRGEFVEWRMDDSGIQMASPTYCGGNLYFFERRRGIVRCVDADTGRLEYESRVRGASAFWASPWTDGKHLYAMDARGNTHVIAAGDELRVVAVNKLEQQAWGTPAIADGRIYLRTVEHLYCIASE